MISNDAKATDSELQNPLECVHIVFILHRILLAEKLCIFMSSSAGGYRKKPTETLSACTFRGRGKNTGKQGNYG